MICQRRMSPGASLLTLMLLINDRSGWMILKFHLPQRKKPKKMNQFQGEDRKLSPDGKLSGSHRKVKAACSWDVRWANKAPLPLGLGLVGDFPFTGGVCELDPNNSLWAPYSLC